MPTIDFYHCSTAPVVTPQPTWRLTVNALNRAFLNIPATCTSVGVTAFQAATCLSVDSNNLFKLPTCRAIFEDYLRQSGTKWEGNPTLSHIKTPANWKGMSQIISIGITLGYLQDKEPNYSCQFKDFEKHWGPENKIPRKWTKRRNYGPDFILYIYSSGEIVVLECKGVTGKFTETKVATHKTQSMNHDANFHVSRSILSTVSFSNKNPVTAHWLNMASDKKNNLSDENLKRARLLTAYSQLINQLEYVGEFLLAKKFIAIPRGKASPQDIKRLEIYIENMEDPFTNNETLRITDDQPLYFLDKKILLHFVESCKNYLTGKLDAALEELKKSVSIHLLNKDSYSQKWPRFEMVHFPTGIIFFKII